MIKQLYLPLIAVALFIVVVGFFSKNPDKLNFLVPKGEVSSTGSEVKINDQVIKVSLANTPSKRERGLSGVSKLEDGNGMLFIFDQKDIKPSFWMKDMLIPIDIIWINDGKIVKIDKNIAPPQRGTPDSSLTLYNPETIIDYVLEVPAGFSDRNSLKINDGMKFDL